MMLALGLHDSFYEQLGGQYPKGLCTYCAINPLSWLRTDQVFDYVFFSNVSQHDTFIVPSAGEINLKGTPSSPLSDHYGLRMQFVLQEHSEEQAPRLIDDRKDSAVVIFSLVEKILLAERKKEFKPYLEKVQAMQRELQTSQGPFFDYYSRFN